MLINIKSYQLLESAMGVALDEIESKAAEKYKNAVYTMGNITVYRYTKHTIECRLSVYLPSN